MYYYLANLGLIIVILYKALMGKETGVINESTNLPVIIFAVIITMGSFEKVAKFIQYYLCPSIWYSSIISFWSIFLISSTFFWALKTFLWEKFQRTRERKVKVPPPADKIGGTILGVLSGIIISGCVALTIYMIPWSEKTYEKLKFEEKPLFLRLDEVIPRGYHLFLILFPGRQEFNPGQFLEKYRSPHFPSGG